METTALDRARRARSGCWAAGKHFRRFVRHQMSIRARPGADGERRLEGELVSADDHGVVVTAPGLPDGRRRLAYGDIERAHTIFDWRAALARTPSPTARSGRRRDAKASSAAGKRDSARREMADTL